MTDAPTALAGITLLDLTRLLPGAFGSQLLADLGAEVIKIEQPGHGDYHRDFPPINVKESGSFLLLNRNKKSLSLNLKSPEGKEIFLRLVELLFVEPLEPSRGQRRAEHADHPRRVKTDLMKSALGGGADPGRGFDADEVGQKRLASARPAPHSFGEDHGHGARRGVDHAARMGVVIVEPVDQRPVHQGRVPESEPGIHADDRIASLLAQAPKRLEGCAGKIMAGRREAGADGVEYMELGPLEHIRRDLNIPDPPGEGGESARDRGGRRARQLVRGLVGQGQTILPNGM